MITKLDIENQREAMQDDLLCVLDGLDNALLDKVCDVIVERMNILLMKLEQSP